MGDDLISSSIAHLRYLPVVDGNVLLVLLMKWLLDTQVGLGNDADDRLDGMRR